MKLYLLFNGAGVSFKLAPAVTAAPSQWRPLTCVRDKWPMRGWKDTWQRRAPAGTRPRWCSSLPRPESGCSTAPLSDRPQWQPPWNPPATGTLGSSATLGGRRGRGQKIVGRVNLTLKWPSMKSADVCGGRSPNVSTSVMHLVSSCRSMSLGTVRGLLSMWPLYFLPQRGQSSKIREDISFFISNNLNSNNID